MADRFPKRMKVTVPIVDLDGNEHKCEVLLQKYVKTRKLTKMPFAVNFLKKKRRVDKAKALRLKQSKKSSSANNEGGSAEEKDKDKKREMTHQKTEASSGEEKDKGKKREMTHQKTEASSGEDPVARISPEKKIEGEIVSKKDAWEYMYKVYGTERPFPPISPTEELESRTEFRKMRDRALANIRYSSYY